MIAVTTPPFHHLPTDLRERRQAQVRDLSDPQNDLLEAIDGLTWQQDLKKADMRRAEEALGSSARKRRDCLADLTCDISAGDRIRRNRIMAEASLAQLHLSTIQKQVEYLERRIAEMRRRLAEIREEITRQTTAELSLPLRQDSERSHFTRRRGE